MPVNIVLTDDKVGEDRRMCKDRDSFVIYSGYFGSRERKKYISRNLRLYVKSNKIVEGSYILTREMVAKI